MAYILESTKYIGIQFSNLSGIYYFLYLLDDIEKTFIEVRTWEGSANTFASLDWEERNEFSGFRL